MREVLESLYTCYTCINLIIQCYLLSNKKRKRIFSLGIKANDLINMLGIMVRKISFFFPPRYKQIWFIGIILRSNLMWNSFNFIFLNRLFIVWYHVITNVLSFNHTIEPNAIPKAKKYDALFCSGTSLNIILKTRIDHFPFYMPLCKYINREYI